MATGTQKPKGGQHINSIANRLEKFFSRVSWLVGFGVVVMMGGVVREAIGRYFFNSPTRWVIELSGYLMIALVFLGGASTYLLDGHVGVDMVYLKLGRPVRRALDLVSYLVVLAYSLVLMWQSWSLAWGSLGSGTTSADMEWPLFPFQVLVPLGCALLSLAALVKVYRFFAPKTGRDLHHGDTENTETVR